MLLNYLWFSQEIWYRIRTTKDHLFASNWLLRIVDWAWFNENFWLKVGVRDTGMIRVVARMRMSDWAIDDTEARIHNSGPKTRVYNRTWLDDNLWLDMTDFRIVRAWLDDT